MYCNLCGKAIAEDARYCSNCGAFVGQSSRPRALVRPRSERKIAGVCMGLARHLDVDVTLIRLLTLVGALFTGIGFIAYLIAWIVIPEEPIVMPHANMVQTQSGPPVT